MKHPASQHLYSYWNDLRSGRAAPERSEIDPAALRGILADMLMIDVEPKTGNRKASFPIRLSGTRVNALFGVDLKGRCMTSLWQLRDRAAVAALFSAVMDDTRPVVAGVTAIPPGEAPISLELLLLPLRHKGKTHARLIGTLAPFSVPAWLGLEVVAPLTLGPHRMIEPPARVSQPGFHGFARSRDEGRRQGHFVIYQGGRL